MKPNYAEMRELSIEMARLMADFKCEDVLVLDVAGMSQITDFLVIGTGTSSRQMQSIGDDLVELGEEKGHGAFRTSRERSASWMIIDFVDVTAHIFEPNARAFYDLEQLWAEAKPIDWKRPAEAGSKAPQS